MHLTEINVGRLHYPLDDPRMAEFVENLDRVNALAEASDGFVWRLKDGGGNATHIRVYEDPLIIVNMSVWTSPDALYEFAYRTAHRRFVQRRKEWFDLFGQAYLALWWVEEGHLPEIADGQLRLAHLQRFGPTPWAFNFRQSFPADANAAPLGDVGDGRRDPESYRLCG